MGLFGSIANIVKKVETTTVGIAKQAGSDIAGGLNLLSSIASHPVDTTKALTKFAVSPSSTTAQNVANVVNRTTTEKATTTIKNTVINTAIASAAILTAGTTAGRAAAVKVISTLTPASAAGKIAVVAAIPISIGVLSSSEKARTAVIDAPSSLANFGSNVGALIENPNLDNLKTTIKDNPVISSGIVAGTAAIVGFAGANLISNAVNTEAIKKNTEATLLNQGKVITSQLPYSKEIQMVEVPKVQSPSENGGVVSTAQTSKTAVATKKKKKKKAVKKKKKVVRKKTTKKKKKVYKKKKTTKKRRKIKKRK